MKRIILLFVFIVIISMAAGAIEVKKKYEITLEFQPNAIFPVGEGELILWD